MILKGEGKNERSQKTSHVCMWRGEGVRQNMRGGVRLGKFFFSGPTSQT